MSAPTREHRSGSGEDMERRDWSERIDAVVAAAREVLAAERTLAVEYVELRDPDLGPTPEIGDARLLIAARAGGTRLIDNANVSVVRRV